MFQKTVESVRPRDWKTWIQDNDGVVVDVREPHEWSEGVLAGAVKIPLGELDRHIHRLDENRAVLTVCRSGRRSEAAARLLRGRGFATVGNLSGGMQALGKAS